MIHIKKGLDIPLAGEPSSTVGSVIAPKKVALIGPDYIGMKPAFRIQEGDHVLAGQPLFEDKKNPGVIFTSPGCGVVEGINRGQRRSFQSITIRLDGDKQVNFKNCTAQEITKLKEQNIRNLLVESGLWTAFRSRPFSRIPAINSKPSSIFVTAIDTNPLAPSVATIIKQVEPDFKAGLEVLGQLTAGKVFVCKAPGTDFSISSEKIVLTDFKGPHPAGLPGTHIHFLDPVHLDKTVWHLGCQDVAAIGHLFSHGKLQLARITALAGPQVKNPRLLKTRLGADISDIVENELADGDSRIISGSVLSGRVAYGPFAFMGRYHQQISVISEGRGRELLGWLAPGTNKYSLKPVFLSRFLGQKRYSLSSSTNGSKRAIVPIGSFEQVMPLDIESTYLLRALAVKDTEQAQNLGCLELDEEDLALLTFADPSKNDFGAMLRENLISIEKDG